MNSIAEWSKTRVAYQIYPRSFCDDNGDGIGDIAGIISKLDYLKKLGIGIIWLSPLYKSPNDDNGYDISDYCSIHPDFGTLDDFDLLLSRAHALDIKIIMDLVINHTSDEHEWFIHSRDAVRNNQSASENPYRDFYYWRKGRNNGKLPPNNWTGFFSGSAWQCDDVSGMYYLRLFSRKQPDLNWHNPAVMAEIKKVLRFWLDRGIDGFRCDVINVIYKDLDNAENLPDGKKRIALTGIEHYHSRPGCHKILHELRNEIFNQYDCFTVGETVVVTPQQANDLCAPDRGELDMVFGFEHMDVDHVNNKWFKIPYRPHRMISVLTKWQKSVGWNTVYFENHDQPRSVSRFGSVKTPELHNRSAKMLATLLLTLRGTPFIYEGEELGMTNGDFSNLSELRDVESSMVNSILRGLHVPQCIRKKMILKTTRDNARTPMQWNAEEKAGFTSGTPWLGINRNHTEINVANEDSDTDSILNYYRNLITFRSSNLYLQNAPFELIVASRNIFAYCRGSLLILLNMSGKNQCLPRTLRKIGRLKNENTIQPLRFVLGNYCSTLDQFPAEKISYGKNGLPCLLRPYESLIFSYNH